VLETLPLLRFTDSQGLGRRVSEEQSVGDLLAAFLRKDLLDLVLRPAKRLDDRIDEFFLGLGLVGLGDLEKITGDCLQPVAQSLNRLVGETLPLSSPLNAIQQVIACKQISRNHESNPAINRGGKVYH
jgi:hypothetical protein